MERVRLLRILAMMMCTVTISVAICVLVCVPIMSQRSMHITIEHNVVATESPIKPIEPIATELIIEYIECTEPIVTEPQVWWTDDELDILAALIYYEAGDDQCSDRFQQLVGQVVLNRVADDRFPNTIYEVITDTRYGVQYSTYKRVLANMGNRDIIPQRCYDNALKALNGEVDCPPDVIFQANFVQGSKIYEEFHTSYSVSYFCYG